MHTTPGLKKGDAVSKLVYDFLVTYGEAHGFPPAIREIASGTFMGTASVMRALDKLEARGCIVREPGRARSIRIVAI